LAFVCVRADPPEILHGAGECGAFTPWQGKQEMPTLPPVKLLPWQERQFSRPLERDGAAFAAVPWESGFAHPAGW
jgi:hypothetical protein